MTSSAVLRVTDPVTRHAYLEYQKRYSKTRKNELERNALRRQTPAYKAQHALLKKAWREKNRERHKAVSRAYDAKQMRENIQRRLSKNLRHRIYKATFGKTRGASAVRDLGLSIPDFRVRLQSLFQPGMTWENYGEWHIDHKRPLIKFDLTDVDQARAACHYTNLQPLWRADNQSKHDFYDEARQLTEA